MPMNEREKALVFAAMNGNTRSFEELYMLYYDKVYALAKTTMKNDADAEDILQATFIKAWQKLHTLSDPSAFNTWLQRITLNLCYSQLRRMRPDYSIDDEGDEGEVMQIESDLLLPEQYAERGDLSVRLRAIIDELSVVQRETVMLYYFSEMSIEEIAKTMGCSTGTVKSRLFLARKAIRTEIEAREKKTGEKFYGVAGIAVVPFAYWFVRSVQSTNISAQAAAGLYQPVSQAVAQMIHQVQMGQAYASQYAQPQAYASRASASGAKHAVRTGAKHAAGASAKHAAGTAAKSSFPLWGKIAAGVIAVSVAAGGGIAVWSAVKNASADKPSQSVVQEVDPAFVVGEKITFGKYEQNNNISDGAEPIEWRILENTDGKALVVSEYALDSLSYSDYSPGVIWSEAELRDYLNGDFYHGSFSQEEQRYISDAYILSDGELETTQWDSVVIDKVFLLSRHETSVYFSSEESAVAYATDYAKANGADTDEAGRTVWRLRLCAYEDPVGVIDTAGKVGTRGSDSDVKCALRPAMWIDTNAMKQKQDAESIVQPIDTSYVNKSLYGFLPGFFGRNYDKEQPGFNSENQEGMNILYKIISYPSCVNYNTYFEGMNEERSHSVTEEPCPIEAINQKGKGFYQAHDADKIDWIAKNIFQCTEADIERMRSTLAEEDERYPAGYSDGVYYAYSALGEPEGYPCHFNCVEGYQKNGYCYYTLDCYWPTMPFQKRSTIDFSSPADVRIYVKTKLLMHEGKPWWSLYYMSDKPSDEWQTAAATAEPTKAHAVVDVDPSEIPQGLDDFLNYFAGRGYAYTMDFDCNDLDSVYTSLITSILNSKPCIDWDMYPGESKKSYEDGADPLGKMHYPFGSCGYEESKLFWIMEHIFHIPSDTCSDMLKKTLEEEGDDQMYEYEQNGKKYLCRWMGVGGPDWSLVYDQVRYDGERYYIIYNFKAGAGNTGNYETCYAELAQEEIDGKMYWTMYRHSRTIPELPAVTGSGN